MKSNLTVIPPTSNRLLIYFTAQYTDISPLYAIGSTPISLGAITNTDYEEKIISKITVDTYGILTVQDIYIDYSMYGYDNLRAKLQISGDGGNTWVDVTNEIQGADGTTEKRVGPGLWISSIDAGIDKLQVRLVAKSSDGNAVDVTLLSDSYYYIVYKKDII